MGGLWAQIPEQIIFPNIVNVTPNIIAEAHDSRYSIHPGSTKMYHYLKEIYWWEIIKGYTFMFTEECPKFQQVKAEQLYVGGHTQSTQMPTQKWEAINIDFVVGLPRLRQIHDFNWVSIDKKTKSSPFIPMKSTYIDDDYVKLYIDERVRWHEVHLSIISDR